MYKVVIDTNVCLSGLVFGGLPEEILRKWRKKTFIVCISAQLKSEICIKLYSPKFALNKKAIATMLKLLEITEKYIPQQKNFISRDKKDNFLLDLAEEAKADYLVTGDKDLLDLKKFGDTTILTPKAFLKIIL